MKHNHDNPLFISADALGQELQTGDVRLIDGSWYLPAMERDGRAEFKNVRISNAVYFDINAIADTSANLPHMLPSPEHFSSEIGRLGISENDNIVVYDGPGMFSAARVWWSLHVMGAINVRILEGGIDNWIASGKSTQSGDVSVPKAVSFKADINPASTKSFDEMLQSLKTGNSKILDARPFKRFTAEMGEPREGLRSGHIPGSHSVPSTSVTQNGTLLSIDELKAVFSDLRIDQSNHIITSCGSGVTAAILSLALESIGHTNYSLYDGSWADWGARDNAPIAQWATPSQG